MPNDERLWAITEGFRRGMMVEEIHALSNIDPWFLRKLQGLVALETRLKVNGKALAQLDGHRKMTAETRSPNASTCACRPAAGSQARRVRRPHDRRIRRRFLK